MAGRVRTLEKLIVERPLRQHRPGDNDHDGPATMEGYESSEIKKMSPQAAVNSCGGAFLRGDTSVKVGAITDRKGRSKGGLWPLKYLLAITGRLGYTGYVCVATHL